MNIQKMITCSPLCLLGFLGLTLFASPATAQVFDSGPSDPSLFDGVIDSPDPDSSQFFTFDGSSTIQLNVSSGGSAVSVEAYGSSEVNISGGCVDFSKLFGSEVNISDGSVGFGSSGVVNSEVNISGGTIDPLFFVGDSSQPTDEGSVVNISGGSVGGSFQANSGSEVNISGGSVGDSFRALSSVVNISGGSVGDSFSARSDSVVSISGGSVGDSFSAGSGCVVNISEGSVGEDFIVDPLSEVNISGGSVGKRFRFRGSELNISGGIIGNGVVVAGAKRIVNISGGSIGDDFDVGLFSHVRLFGSDFALDDVPLESLTVDEAFTIVDRDVTLSGLFADGSPFSFDLNSIDDFGEDYFDPTATLTVTLVAPVTIILGDCDLDGEVSFADIPPFIAILQSGGFLEQADCNQDSVVDFSDISSFIAILSGS